MRAHIRSRPKVNAMKKILAILIIATVLTLVLVGCSEQGDQTDFSGKVKVVFELEGGTYQNCKTAVVNYYAFKEGTANLISPLGAFKPNSTFTNGELVFDGWYKTKTQNGDKVSYSGKWDFESDTVDENGIVLYAKWASPIHHTYTVCYKNEGGETIALGSYEVEEGEVFSDYIHNYANKRAGYTFLSFVDENGNPWNQSFTHPGGETDSDIKVYCTYVKGFFQLVSTPAELIKAKASNIYLLNDIDMEGATFSFGDYKKTLIGNGHTISNFVINNTNELKQSPESGSLLVSIFGNAEDAVVENVNFENVSLIVDTTFSKIKQVYIAPLAVVAEKCSFTNVTFDGTYEIKKLPADFSEEENLIVVDGAYLINTDTATEGVTVNLTKTTEQTEE